MAAYISFQPTDVFNTKLYTGTGSSNAITGVGFQPDFVWTKNRDSTDNHNLFDAVRGATKFISTNLPSAEGTTAESLKSFDADGFTVGTWGDTNGNTEDYVSWNWKAGTTTGIAGSPSITPTAYSFNATSGFSIIQYTGTAAAATLPHGLGVAPGLIIIKKTTGSQNWGTYHKAIGETKYLIFDTNAAEATSTAYWNDTAPTSTLFSVGDNHAVNQASNDFVAYCFAEKSGYSKFGKYTGNANADGPFIYTGFRPAFLIIKCSSTLNGWFMFDDKRIGYNQAHSAFEADGNFAESATSTYPLDILSNGFKPRHLSAAFNGSGIEYVYIAFSEFPFVSSNSIPTVAK